MAHCGGDAQALALTLHPLGKAEGAAHAVIMAACLVATGLFGKAAALGTLGEGGEMVAAIADKTAVALMLGDDDLGAGFAGHDGFEKGRHRDVAVRVDLAKLAAVVKGVHGYPLVRSLRVAG